MFIDGRNLRKFVGCIVTPFSEALSGKVLLYIDYNANVWYADDIIIHNKSFDDKNGEFHNHWFDPNGDEFSILEIEVDPKDKDKIIKKYFTK